MADLNSLSTKAANEEGVAMIISDPVTGDNLENDQGEPMTIYLVGSDSKEVTSFQAEIHSKYRGKKEPSFGASKKHAIDLLVRCTKGWDNLQVNSEDLAFSATAARDLYTTLPAVRDQVSEFIDDRSNFLGNSE